MRGGGSGRGERKAVKVVSDKNTTKQEKGGCISDTGILIQENDDLLAADSPP